MFSVLVNEDEIFRLTPTPGKQSTSNCVISLGPLDVVRSSCYVKPGKLYWIPACHIALHGLRRPTNVLHVGTSVVKLK